MKTNLSERVIQILEACKINKSEILDLSGCQLTNIPKELNDFSWVTTLYLILNQITKIENLNKLPNLTELYLSYNQITKIEALDKMPNLTGLALDSNQITKIENLDRLPKLKTLYLPYNQITQIENLDKLSNLTRLALYSNQISSIPSSITLLQNLEWLGLSKNFLDKSEINKLAYLLPTCEVR